MFISLYILLETAKLCLFIYAGSGSAYGNYSGDCGSDINGDIGDDIGDIVCSTLGYTLIISILEVDFSVCSHQL